MQRLDTAQQLRAWRAEASGNVGLVPTMGNLHAGHLALVAAARARCERVVVSIFVNPLQFGPNEDLDSYPRTLDADLQALEQAGADAVFAPAVEQMYPHGGTTATTVRVEGITDMLCGSRRPGHFEGVATVVTKLLNLVDPDEAFFGEKDFQQLAVIRRLVADLCMQVDIVGVPTVREADGLALSSRNQYLQADERERAPALAAALADCRARLSEGERDFVALEARGRAMIDAAGLKTDYFEIRSPELTAPRADMKAFRVLAAAFLGRARLIDNMAVEPAPGQ
ncbi:pantoate--beta-alanine ligase [uncultured Salinisphaera sp.]|uniref:pantoate--beta-alanine ligase n=1 Tax=uncultured Salinisphaera sp. TaxID=359372 RepID=UPI0032B17946